MKMFKMLFAVFLTCCLLSCTAVKAEAKFQAKPFEAEQNFRLLQKTMETAKLDPDEGSGDDLDDDYYDDEYYDEDYDDEDSDFGSGLDEDWLPHEPSEDKAELIPDEIPEKDSDFHFNEEHDHMDNKKKDAYDDLLYEYYNELQYDDDDDYLDQVEQDLNHDQEVIVTKPEGHDLAGKFSFQPSYIFLMLTSALISFAIFILAFILCRRSVQRHHKKSLMVPFIVSSTDFSSAGSKHHSTPIVKNYQRVPTSTKELMQAQHTVEMQQNQSERPLLT